MFAPLFEALLEREEDIGAAFAQGYLHTSILGDCIFVSYSKGCEQYYSWKE